MEFLWDMFKGLMYLGVFLQFGLPALMFLIVIIVGVFSAVFKEGGILSFKGRMGRLDAFIHSRITVVIEILCTYLGTLVIDEDFTFLVVILGVILILNNLRFIVIMWRRLHDIGVSGLFYLPVFAIEIMSEPYPFMEIISIIVNLVILLIPGNAAANKYGDVPPPMRLYTRCKEYLRTLHKVKSPRISETDQPMEIEEISSTNMSGLVEWEERIPRSVKSCYFRILLATIIVVLYLVITACIGFSAYDMYMLLRVCVFVYCAMMIYTTCYLDSFVKYMYTIIGLIFNPFFMLHFSKGFWSIIDLLTAVIFACSAYYVLKRLYAADDKNRLPQRD